MRKIGIATLQPPDLVKQQLAIKLKRLERRIAKLTAESEEIRTYLANAEATAKIPSGGIRKNALTKWTVRSHVRRLLGEKGSAAKVQYLYGKLREVDPTLNKSTFRSHIKRMVDDQIIKREGPRGSYWLIESVIEREKEPKGISRRRRSNKFLYGIE